MLTAKRLQFTQDQSSSGSKDKRVHTCKPNIPPHSTLHKLNRSYKQLANHKTLHFVYMKACNNHGLKSTDPMKPLQKLWIFTDQHFETKTLKTIIIFQWYQFSTIWLALSILKFFSVINSTLTNSLLQFYSIWEKLANLLRNKLTLQHIYLNVCI